MESTVGFLTANWLILPVARNLTAFFINFHVSESADIPETATLLPERADCLISQSSFTVAEGTAVSLVTGGIEIEVAVVSLIRHNQQSLRTSSDSKGSLSTGTSSSPGKSLLHSFLDFKSPNGVISQIFFLKVTLDNFSKDIDLQRLPVNFSCRPNQY